MAASTVDIPAIVLSGGPMLDGWMDGELVGSGAAIWKGRRQLSAGRIDEEKFLQIAAASAPSAGHCNTMGTASTMNAMAEALGMSLTGCSAIPAPYRERGHIAYETGRRIVGMAYEDQRPSTISLPTLGDGRQSGTSDSPSILNASPESAVGGGLAYLRSGDRIHIDLNTGRCDMLVGDDELSRRKAEGLPAVPASQTPWQEIYRATVGQLESGACMELALQYRGVGAFLPRHNH